MTPFERLAAHASAAGGHVRAWLDCRVWHVFAVGSDGEGIAFGSASTLTGAAIEALAEMCAETDEEQLDRIFGPCPTVDPGTLLEELGELRTDLRTIERAHGWHDEDDGEPVEMAETW